jgi:glycosyltransferase involved in cell wall biosynthesis
MSTTPRKVVVLVDWFWPGFRAGGPIRSTHNLIRWLQHDFDFSVITSDTDHLADAPYTEVKSNEWTTTPDGIRTFYAPLCTLTRKQLKTLIQEESPDFLLLNSMFSLPFTIWPLWQFARKKSSLRILLAPRGMLADGSFSQKSRKKQIFLQLFRLKGWHRRITFIATGAHEAADIRRHFGPEVSLKIAPNLPEMELPPLKPMTKKPGEVRFISVARFSPEKNNLWLLQRFAEMKEPATLILYGPVGEKNYWQQCQGVIASLPPHLKVEYKGALPAEQIREKMEEAQFFLLPTLGENFGHAIFEALAAGRPVIISDTTPWRGLASVSAGWDLPLSDPSAFTAQLDHASRMDDAAFQPLSAGAREYARKFHGDAQLLEQNRAVFNP